MYCRVYTNAQRVSRDAPAAMQKAGRRKTLSFIIRDPDEPWNRSGVNALQIDPLARRLYTAGRDSIIRTWDISDNKERPQYVRAMEHHTDWVNDIVLCQGGRNIFSASSDATLKLWDTQSGQCTATLRTHKDYIKALAYSPEREVAVSGGLENSIFLWDLNTLANLTSTNNTITTNTFSGNRSSVYSLCIDPAGKLLVSGSSDKMIRIWDTSSYTLQMELRGHTDNVRTLALSQDGTLLLSGSSDGTVRLWSVIQQCCIETFRLHDEGVWTVAVDDSFSTFYSSGRDKQVCVTHLKTSTSRQLFMEEAPVVRLVLDTVDSSPSIWAATTNTCINKWPIQENCSDEEDPTNNEEEEEVTDIDMMDMTVQPLATIPGGSCLKEYRILPNKREILTRDSAGNVALWSVLFAKKLMDLGKVDLQEEMERRAEELYTPNWFSVELKTGMLTVRLEESDYSSAWVLASRSGLSDINTDLNLNLGALMLRALYEHWPGAYINQSSSEEETSSVAHKKFFSVPDHTPLYIAEAGDCGCTLVRIHCQDAVGQHESRLLEQHTPHWILDYVEKNCLPPYIKVNFSSAPHPESFLSEDRSRREEHLQAPDFLPVLRIVERAYSQIYGEKGKVSVSGEKVAPRDQLALYCQGQLVDVDLDFRTVKHHIWKSGGEIKFHYALRRDDKVGRKDESLSV